MSNVVELKRRFMTVQDLIDMGRRPNEHASCAGCLFWSPRNEAEGDCRVESPRVAKGVEYRCTDLLGVFPITIDGDFCAKWQGEPRDL